MPLSYRGIPYQPTSSPLETTDSKNLGKYRGSSFSYPQRELIPFPHSFFILKYRGIPYLALGRFSFQSQLQQSSSPHKNKHYNGKDEG